MAKTHTPLPVKLFVGILTSLPETVPQAEEQLARLYGNVDSRSGPALFDLTHYYDQDMGSPIYRYFFSFAKLIDPSDIAAIKLQTNGLESAFASQYSAPRRPINLDPGYLEQSKIVLASTKNYFHRILIAGGIYAEVTLHFEKGQWRSFPWTFPDYRTQQYQQFFSSLRSLYRTQLRELGIRIRVQ